MAQKSKMVPRDGGGELNVLGVDLRFLCEAEDTDGKWSLMETLIRREAGPPAHFHDWGEGYYLISGEVEFEIEGERTRARPGDFIYTPGGTVHAFRGVSEEPARMLIIDAPAHALGFFKEVDRDVEDLARHGHKIPGIGAANGVHFLELEEN